MPLSNVKLEGRVSERTDGALAVSGVLTFDTVPGVYASSVDWIKKSNGLARIDLAEVAKADSAGLALMIEWLERARAAGRELRFMNVPEQVKTLIEVSGLGAVLSV